MGDEFKVLGVNHVTVTAPDDLETETLDWYTTCLGLDAVAKPDGAGDRGGWFSAGDQEVHVLIDEHNPHHAAHFALVVTDFDEIITRLREAKCHIEQASPIPGRRRCFTRDPAGNRIELMAYKQEGA